MLIDFVLSHRKHVFACLVGPCIAVGTHTVLVQRKQWHTFTTDCYRRPALDMLTYVALGLGVLVDCMLCCRTLDASKAAAAVCYLPSE